MTNIFNEGDHVRLSELFNTPGYKGYKPNEAEAPNSDGHVDVGKRYLHVAPKYEPPEWAMWFLARAHYEACRIAEMIGVPDAFMPRVENGTLRVLEYPEGTGTTEHTDFDLFTVNLWRSTPNDHEHHLSGTDWFRGAQAFHVGRIGTMVGLGSAALHRVPERPYPQKAIVYFAMPGNSVIFPNGSQDLDTGVFWDGERVSAWLDTVYSKSRVYR